MLGRVNHPGADDVHALGTIDLVGGIVEDARDLFAAHVEALREDMSVRVATLGATLGSLLIAIGVFVVTALLLSLAVAATLVAAGMPPWVALWIVMLVAGAIGVGFVFRTRAKARVAARSIAAAAHRVRADVARIGSAPVSTTT